MIFKLQLRAAVLYTLVAVTSAVTPAASADEVNWTENLQAARQAAAVSGRPLLMKFTADWCGYCKIMERTTFRDPEVTALVNGYFVPVLIDADKHEELCRQLHVTRFPATLIMTPDLRLIDTITGYQTAEKILPNLNRIVSAIRPELSAADTVQQPAGSASVHSGMSAYAASVPANTTPVQTAARSAEPGGVPAATGQNPAVSASTTIGAAVQTSNTPEGTRNPFSTVTNRPTEETPQPPEAALPAFKGKCLVTALTKHTLQPGNPQYALRYRSRTLLFAGPDELEAFRAKPEAYWPALEGYSPLQLLATGHKVEGELQFGAVFDNQVWLFRSAEEMHSFIDSPSMYVNQLRRMQQ